MARQADHVERRRLFAAAALNVISRDGLEGLTLREVAREAGFTTGALTHYFQSKDELLIAASEYSAELVRVPMDELALGASARESLRQLIYTALPSTTVMKGNWRFWVAFWERGAHSPRVNQVMRDRYHEWTNRVASLVRRAQEQGQARADLDAARFAHELVALVDGIGVQVLIGVGKLTAPTQRQMVDAFIDIRLDAGAPSGSASPPVKTARTARRTRA